MIGTRRSVASSMRARSTLPPSLIRDRGIYRRVPEHDLTYYRIDEVCMVSNAFEVLDYVVIAVYLVGITAIGIWTGFRRHASSEQYFLASKSLGWFTVGAAVFASNISTIHLVGLAADGADRTGGWQLRVDGLLHADPAGVGLCAVLPPHADHYVARVPRKAIRPAGADHPGHHRHPAAHY